MATVDRADRATRAATRISLGADGAGARLDLSGAAVVPRRIAASARFAHVALVAGRALLLGGDRIELQVEVDPGCRLVVEDIGGTVAYDGEGCAASWEVSVIVREGASVRWDGLPFVVADGADVSRSLNVELDDGATAVLRETVVLGRVGERGGRLTSATRVERCGRPLVVETLSLAGGRGVPGVAGRHRVFDTLMAVGDDDAAHLRAHEGRHDGAEQGVTRLELERGGVLHRWLGSEAHLSPLARLTDRP